MSVIIETSLGDITIDLFTDERPKCCKNFLKLCKVKYYNFCLFHSVQRNFIAQTGDPTGTGKGGESIHGFLYGEQARYFDWEFVPKIKHVKSGLVSMVNNGNNMHGSQFFITLGDSLDYLDGVHTVFGEITEGLEVVTKLNEAYCDEKFKPFRDVRIHHTIILDDPFEDPPGLDVPDRSPSPTPEVIERARLAADAEIDDLEGKTEEEIKEIMDEREEKANAQILEMIGDLPSTDVTAPENVLFVCKLNSVTTDEDLEIIFSRFGAIKSCEVIRDHKTGESLQYAFIEFEKREYCESAYFKMDNVLIDDRRIHVDFSQSVSKFKWKGKGKGVDTLKEDPKKPKYITKDKSQRQDNNYELIFEENGNSKSTKKKHKEKSQDTEDNYRHKKKANYRSRSRSPDRRRHRSQDKERRDYRDSRDTYHREEKKRYSPPRYRDDRRLSPPRHRDDRRLSPPRHRDDRRSSPPRHRDDRRSSPSRYRDYRRDSPPRYRDRRDMSPPRHRGSPQKETRDRGRDVDIRKSPDRKSKTMSEKLKLNSDRKKNKDQKYDSSDEDESLDRTKGRKVKKYADSSDDQSPDRLKKTNKKRHSVSSDDQSSDRKKRKKMKHSESSDDEKQKNKRNKKFAASSDEDEKVKRKKKKKKQDSSDENEKVHKKKKKKKVELSDEENKMSKKKKKKQDTSSEEDVPSRDRLGKKKRHSDSGDRNVNNSDSDSPVHKKSVRHGSDKHRSHSSKEKRKHKNSEESDRKYKKEGHKEKHR